MPEINFRFFEDDKEDLDLKAMVKAVEFGRKVFTEIAEEGSEFALFEEVLPCRQDFGEECDVLETIRAQTWSHHGTSTCAIGGDGDEMAVLDSRFRLRGMRGLRVVDWSAFPRTPGGFPVIPTFMLAEKGADVILEDNA